MLTTLNTEMLINHVFICIPEYYFRRKCESITSAESPLALGGNLEFTELSVGSHKPKREGRIWAYRLISVKEPALGLDCLHGSSDTHLMQQVQLILQGSHSAGTPRFSLPSYQGINLINKFIRGQFQFPINGMLFISVLGQQSYLKVFFKKINKLGFQKLQVSIILPNNYFIFSSISLSPCTFYHLTCLFHFSKCFDYHFRIIIPLNRYATFPFSCYLV